MNRGKFAVTYMNRRSFAFTFHTLTGKTIRGVMSSQNITRLNVTPERIQFGASEFRDGKKMFTVAWETGKVERYRLQQLLDLIGKSAMSGYQDMQFAMTHIYHSTRQPKHQSTKGSVSA